MQFTFTTKPVDLLAKHRLPTAAVRPLPGGNVNQVWATEKHVVRIGSVTDHAREAQLALAVLEVGVRTPRPVAWGENYSIWERLQGSTPTDGGRTVGPDTWAALLDDLELLHAHPLEVLDEVHVPQAWRGRAWLVEATQQKADWTPDERARLVPALDEPAADLRPTFVHGDAYAGNVLLDEHGRYLAIVDWGCAGWASLEAECARLENEALVLARERWSDRLDLALVWRMRLDLFLEVARDGRMPFERVRRLLAARSVRSA